MIEMVWYDKTFLYAFLSVCVDNGIKPMDEEAHCTIFEKTILDFKVRYNSC